jgi:hypothetical protein
MFRLGQYNPLLKEAWVALVAEKHRVGRVKIGQRGGERLVVKQALEHMVRRDWKKLRGRHACGPMPNQNIGGLSAMSE